MDEPLYRQIAEDLKTKIETGKLARGAPLPTEEHLGEMYGNASRNTIREALKWLTARGLVETQRGRGSKVTMKIDPFVTTLSANPSTGLGGGEGAAYGSEVEATSRKPSTTSPQVEIQQANEPVAEALRIELGSTVVSRHQRRSIDETLWSLQTSYYPMELVTRGADRLLQASDIDEGTVVYLGEKLGIKQGYRDAITVRAPNDDETAKFKLPGDGRVAVVVIARTAFDDRGQPFRVTVSVFPADRNKFLINVGDVPHDPPHRDLS